MFVTPDLNLVIHDLVNGNSKYIEEYLEIYRNLFPQYVRYLPVMRKRAEVKAEQASIEKWHQWLLVIDNEPVGIVGFLYNRKRNVGLLMDFAVLPNARKIRLGADNVTFAQYILNLSMQKLVQDAQENQNQSPICMAAEVEYPSLVRKYIEYGYITFPVEYFEPPFTPELELVGDKIHELRSANFGKMNIGAFPIPGYPMDLQNSETIRTVLLSFLEDHYQLPSDHWLIQKVVQEIPA